MGENTKQETKLKIYMEFHHNKELTAKETMNMQSIEWENIFRLYI